MTTYHGLEPLILIKAEQAKMNGKYRMVGGENEYDVILGTTHHFRAG